MENEKQNSNVYKKKISYNMLRLKAMEGVHIGFNINYNMLNHYFSLLFLKC